MKEDALHKLLHDGLPNHRSKWDERVDVNLLAADLGISRQAVYKWFERGRVPARQIKNILGLKGCTLTQDDAFRLIDTN